MKGERTPTDVVSRSMLSKAAGTSIFDPVLCELVYRWFAGPNSVVLDPFAGGSVRGVVAAALGRKYVGIDIAENQILANRAQWDGIGPKLRKGVIEGGLVRVKVSAKSARQAFNGCEPDYIRDVCHAACCKSSTAPTGTIISIHPTEEAKIRARGGEIKDGLLLPLAGERMCQFEGKESHLCGLHGSDDKPFGCIASPFTLNKNNTLIVRNRYRLLKCYNDGPKIPAYKAFRTSLNMLFGSDESQRICDHLEGGGWRFGCMDAD